MALPQIVTSKQWIAARRELLGREKELTRQQDALNADRRRLPMVRIEKDYRFQGASGEVGLAELFGGCRQLIVQHFMFDPSWEKGCSSCTAASDELSSGLLEHLHARDTAFAVVSRAPYDKLRPYQDSKGWAFFDWYSSYGSDFNYDFHVSLDASVAPVMFNYRDRPSWRRQVWVGSPSSRASSPVTAACCARARTSSTPTPPSAAVPSSSVAATPSWT